MGNALNERWWDRTLADVLRPVLAADPEHEALIHRGRVLSYRQFDAQVDRAALALRSIGVAPGDRVAASIPNSIEIVVAFHAVARLGAVWVGINRLLAGPEKLFILQDAGVTVLLADAACIDQIGDDTTIGMRIVEVAPDGGRSEWHDLLDAAADATLEPVAMSPSDPVAIAYTSGTTGFPKGVVHSHRNLLVAAAMLVVTRGYGGDLRKADWLAFTILNVATASSLVICQAGGTHVIIDSSQAREIAGEIERTAATVFQGVPPVLHTMVADPSIAPSQLSTLREVLTGSAATPERLQRSFADKFGLRLVGTYGLTEAPIMLALDAPDGADHVDGGSGRTLPHVEIVCVDGDDRRLPDGEVGELCVAPATSGEFAGIYTPMLGYWNLPEATATVLRNGMMHTGDVGHIGPGGQVFVSDRKNALIIRGGSNVYPAEVERAISALAGVADCAVFGVPDERLGERVVAAVQLDPGAAITADMIRTDLVDKVAAYKIPERITFVESFQRNSMNKIIRTELGKLAEAAGRA
ncbi:MAG: AMP-dependent synthetase and ligase [Ilumatobacteraceae bacterium]|nr:AMP-dependent synthetase and ligase [Ilumatobacteraceae bacterium]